MNGASIKAKLPTYLTMLNQPQPAVSESKDMEKQERDTDHRIYSEKKKCKSSIPSSLDSDGDSNSESSMVKCQLDRGQSTDGKR